MDSLNDKNHIMEFLRKNPVGVLSMVDPSNLPHATVLYYAVDPEFNISFITKNETKKFDNLQHNNNAVMIVFDTLSQTTAQVYGTVSIIEDQIKAQEVFANALQSSMNTSGAVTLPIAKLHAGSYTAFQLKPSSVKMSVFDDLDENADSNLFNRVQFYEVNF
jgi:general stress protein 26